MKKVIYIAVMAMIIVSCKQEPKDYVTFSGKITNKNSDSLLVLNPKIQYKKVIKVNDDGTFTDTLKANENYFSVFDGKEYLSIYVKNGDDINMNLDAAAFDTSLKFTGLGSEASNKLAEATLVQEKIFKDNSLFKLERTEFTEKINSLTDSFLKELETSNGLDSTFIADQKKNFNGLKGFINNMYAEKHYLATTLSEGTQSPTFTNYENYAGGETSLDDLKGKYVYIDLWATWCGPCKVEIPYLKQIEKDFHDKNIAFVSISLDRKNAYNKWKKMVQEKELTGIQLYANEDESFVDAYKVNGIPRFILLDPQGKIVSADAPRPSDPKLVKLFEDLKI